MDTTVIVREAMNKNVVTKSLAAKVNEIAKIMRAKNIGSVIIVDNKGNPAGIVTERDICYKIAAENRDASKTAAKDIMTSKLISISPGKSIEEAAKVMAKKGIRRLAVMEKSKLVGIVTASDILSVSPHTVEVLNELYQIYAGPEEGSAEKPEVEGGVCDECATFTDKLYAVGNRYLCEDCKEDETEE